MNSFAFYCGLLLLLAASPFVLYVMAKVVGFGASMGRHRFQQYLKREEEKNGNKDEESTQAAREAAKGDR